MLWQRDQKKGCNVSFHDYFLIIFSLSYIKGYAPFVFGLFLSHVAFMYGFSKSIWKSHYKRYIMLLFSCCTFLVPPLSLHHVYCFCICRKNKSDGRGDLPADLLIIHHSHVVFIVHSGWVSTSNLHIPSLRVRLHYDWGWLKGHLWSPGKWTAVLLLACCQTFCLSAFLPAPSDLAWCGWNSNEYSIWVLSLEYALKCH